MSLQHFGSLELSTSQERDASNVWPNWPDRCNSSRTTEISAITSYTYFPYQKKYCWWKKYCTTQHVWNPVNNGIFTISTGAGFPPSTVPLGETSVVLLFFFCWLNRGMAIPRPWPFPLRSHGDLDRNRRFLAHFWRDPKGLIGWILLEVG